MSAQFVAQRRVLLGQAPVSMCPTPLAHRSQRPAEPVLRRLALDHPAPLPGASPIVGEPQHHEAALALRAAPLRLRRPAKLHHPRLLRVQPQPVLLPPLRQHPMHPSRVVLVLEHQHRVVGVADLKRPPPKPRLHFVLEPLIEHFVQGDVARVSFGSLCASSAILRGRVEMTSRPNVPAICPCASSIIRSGASLRRVPWGEFPDLIGSYQPTPTSRPPLVRRFVSFAQHYHRLALLRSLGTGRLPVGLDHFYRAARAASPRWRRRDPGACATLAYMSRSSTPADPRPQATSGPAMWSSAGLTASTPQRSFRGSITRPARSLCTLRSRGRPRTTQHSIPARGQP